METNNLTAKLMEFDNRLTPERMRERLTTLSQRKRHHIENQLRYTCEPVVKFHRDEAEQLAARINNLNIKLLLTPND